MRGFFSLVFSILLHFIPNALSEMNLIQIVFSIVIDKATLKILVLCVSWFTRKLAHTRTDRQTDKAIT